jgi:hypothetical protein
VSCFNGILKTEDKGCGGHPKPSAQEECFEAPCEYEKVFLSAHDKKHELETARLHSEISRLKVLLVTGRSDQTSDASSIKEAGAFMVPLVLLMCLCA